MRNWYIKFLTATEIQTTSEFGLLLPLEQLMSTSKQED